MFLPALFNYLHGAIRSTALRSFLVPTTFIIVNKNHKESDMTKLSNYISSIDIQWCTNIEHLQFKPCYQYPSRGLRCVTSGSCVHHHSHCSVWPMPEGWSAPMSKGNFPPSILRSSQKGDLLLLQLPRWGSEWRDREWLLLSLVLLWWAFPTLTCTRLVEAIYIPWNLRSSS